MIVDVVIPAVNEEASIGKVVAEIDRQLVRHVVVVDNGSSDRTSEVARAAGAMVLHEGTLGYGAACLKGVSWLRNQEPVCEILAFLDGDYSDYPGELAKIIQPIVRNEVDLVIGSRVLGQREGGAMLPQQVFGNWLATRLIRIFYGVKFSDLGPFRAIKWTAYERLGMADRNYGWTVEMQVKAARLGIRCTEVPVNYRVRIGKSKVAGTFKGTVMAGYKILLTIFRYL